MLPRCPICGAAGGAHYDACPQEPKLVKRFNTPRLARGRRLDSDPQRRTCSTCPAPIGPGKAGRKCPKCLAAHPLVSDLVAKVLS